MRLRQSVRQLQIEQWLKKSRRPLTIRELRDLLGLECHFRTIKRDIEVLGMVIDIDKTRCVTEDGIFVKYRYVGPKEILKFGPKKRCFKCGDLKDREADFWRDWKEPDERDKRCIACMKKNQRTDQRRKYDRDYYHNHKKRLNGNRQKRRDLDRSIGTRMTA